MPKKIKKGWVLPVLHTMERDWTQLPVIAPKFERNTDEVMCVHITED